MVSIQLPLEVNVTASSKCDLRLGSSKIMTPVRGRSILVDAMSHGPCELEGRLILPVVSVCVRVALHVLRITPQWSAWRRHK